MEYVYLDEQEMKEVREVLNWSKENEQMKELMESLKKLKKLDHDIFVRIVKVLREILDIHIEIEKRYI